MSYNTDSVLVLPKNTEVNQYIIIDVLGQGGFGIVYKAKHKFKNKIVAMKEFLPSQIASRAQSTVLPHDNTRRSVFDKTKKRFIDEGIILTELRHERVIQCEDIFEANGTAYLVMHFEDGLPLDKLLVSKEKTEQPFTEKQLISLFIEIAKGIKYIHDNNILHRDISPDNIFVRRIDSAPLLIDFGAAKQNFAQQTQSKAPYKDFYAPIEQLDAEGEANACIDIHAFGGLMYRCVTGKVGASAETRSYKLATGKPDPLLSCSDIAQSSYHKELLELIDQCLAFTADDRPQNMEQVILVLESIRGEQATESKDTSSPLSMLDSLIDTAGADKIVNDAEIKSILAFAKTLDIPEDTALQYTLQKAHTNGWEIITNTKKDSHSETFIEKIDELIFIVAADNRITKAQLEAILTKAESLGLTREKATEHVEMMSSIHGWTIDTNDKKPQEKESLLPDIGQDVYSAISISKEQINLPGVLVELAHKSVMVKIPKDIKSTKTIRLKGMGQVGKVKNGDVYLNVSILADPKSETIDQENRDKHRFNNLEDLEAGDMPINIPQNNSTAQKAYTDDKQKSALESIPLDDIYLTKKNKKYYSVHYFAEKKNIDVNKATSMIQNGFYDGFCEQDTWYVAEDEFDEKSKHNNSEKMSLLTKLRKGKLGLGRTFWTWFFLPVGLLLLLIISDTFDDAFPSQWVFLWFYIPMLATQLMATIGIYNMKENKDIVFFWWGVAFITTQLMWAGHLFFIAAVYFKMF